VKAVDETPYRLAYESSIRAITDQSGALEGLRGRAGTMFAATALVTSFLGGQALTRLQNDGRLPTFHPVSFTGAGFLAFVLLALVTFAIVWPYRVRFSLSPSQLLEIVDERARERPVTGQEAYRELALRNEAMYDFNAKRIRLLFWCLRLAIFCLVGEVAAWLIVIYRGTP
jgi:hypothetical protein